MNIIQFKGGYRFSLKDAPDNLITYIPTSNIVALVPPRIIGFKAKIIVTVGENICLGQTLFYNRKDKNLKFTSPSSGTVRNIIYGAKRSLKAIEISISNSNKNSHITFTKENLEKMSELAIVNNLINSGIWSKLKSFPGFEFIEKESFLSNKNKQLFLSLFSTEPHVANIMHLLEDKNYCKYFLYGLQVCSKIFTKINIFNNNTTTNGEISKYLKNVENIFFYNIENKYPADNPGLQCLMINKTSSDFLNICSKAFTIIEIGYLFTHESIIKDRYMSLSGNGINRKINIIAQAGQSIKHILSDTLKNSDDYRFISGGLLTGKKISYSDYLADDDISLHVVKEDRGRIVLSFFRLGFNKFTLTKTWLSGFIPQERYEVSTNNNGEERACIQCGYCYDVCPVEIMPSLLMKASNVNDIEKMEYLSIHECIECELCTFICPSKIEIGQHIKNGKEFIKKEG